MVAAALDVVGAQVGDVREAVRVDEGSPQTLGSGMPGFGTSKSVLRRESSICSSFRYSRSPRLCSAGPSPICSTRSGLPKVTPSGTTSVIVPSALSSIVMPLARKAASWLPEYVPAGTVGSNSP